MKTAITMFTVLAAALVFAAAGSLHADCGSCGAHKSTEEAKAEPTADEQVAGLEQMCAKNSSVMAERNKEKSFYERLGGEKKIHEFTKELMRVHMENPDVAYRLENLDRDQVAHRVALFIISGTGGPQVYDGPSLPDSHRHMKLTNADFMAAGVDIIQAMKNVGYGQNEIDDMVCTLVSLRDQVVLTEESDGKTAGHSDHSGHSHN
jgi:hemoglobin